MDEARIQFARELFERLEGNRRVVVQEAQRKLRILEVLSR
jgi:hypothetical protein